MSRLTLLGTGTCQLEFERRASSVLLELNGTYILFDCGHGIFQRLLEAGVQHNQVHHIILSHFHPDHVSDLIPFMQAGAWSRRNPRTQDLHIYGPTGVEAVIDHLMQAFGPTSFRQSSYAIHVHEVKAGTFAVAEQLFESISLPPSNNHGLRFAWRDKRYAITGDSAFHEQEIAFLKGVDLAIIDAGHIEDNEIVQLAVSSQARHIICSHLYREINALKLQALAMQRGYSGEISVGQDLLSFML